MTALPKYWCHFLFAMFLLGSSAIPAQTTGVSGVQSLARRAPTQTPRASAKGRTILQGPVGFAGTATNLFEQFVRFPEETRQFIQMDTGNIAYYRDVFAGGETLTSNPSDGDVISATIQGPNESVPEQAIPFVFHTNFNGQQNCWVSQGIQPLCNSSSIDVTWFKQIQCAQDGTWTIQFLYNGAVYSSGTFYIAATGEAGRYSRHLQSIGLQH